MTTAVSGGTYLHHIQLESTNPASLAAFYADAMNMTEEKTQDGRFLCVGPGRRILITKGRAKALGFAAFACRDAEALALIRDRVAKSGLAIEKSPSPLLKPGAFAVRDPDDNVIVFGLAATPEVRTGGLKGPIQHLTLATFDVNAIERFYVDKLGFAVSDRVVNDDGVATTCFMRSNHEHHSLACFLSSEKGIDHHSYEAGDWTVMKDWADRMGEREIPLMWGPGRHGPGNNLFIFIEDPDRNWIEISAELETIHDRGVKQWPHGERTLNLWGKAIMRS